MIQTYYKKRAEEYEKIYFRDDPVRQKEQRMIAKKLQKVMNNRNVLEIACGTGYWTQFLSETAKSIISTDINQEVITIAKQKIYQIPIIFKIKDAYALSFKQNSFTGGLANFWFSHIPRMKIDNFLNEFHRVMKPGAQIFIADNVLIEGIGGKLLTKKREIDTYKERFLSDGSRTLVLKNYYTRKEILAMFNRYDPYLKPSNIYYGKCFWFIHYQLP